MLSFQDWVRLNTEDSPTTRILNSPWAYPVQAVANPNSHATATPQQLSNWNYMLKRDTAKKKKRKKKHKVVEESSKRPDTSIDKFVKEIEGIKDDIDKAKKKPHKPTVKSDDKPEEKPDDKPTTATLKDDDAETLKYARLALATLRRTPMFYQDKGDAGDSGVSDEAAKRVARNLGVDFSNSKFSLDAFRKGIQFEKSRGTVESVCIPPRIFVS